MITYIKGDLLQTDVNIIVHGCNAQGVMGSGVALTIKNKYPLAYKYYREQYECGLLYLGNVIPVRTRENNKNIHILNAITQQYYGKDGKQYVSYPALRSCFKYIPKYCKKYKDWYNEPNNISQIAMPKIGAGLGGGDWNIIERIIEEELKDFEVLVYEL